MSNPVTHWQILTSEPEKVAAFYAGVFGWRVSDANGLGYRTVASGNGRGIDGGIWPSPPGAPETVQIYVEVADIDDALSRIQDQGGRMLMPKQVLPDGDAMALALDPTGRVFGLTTPKASTSAPS